MEAFKAELMKEVRKEFQKIKQEIVDGNYYALPCPFFSYPWLFSEMKAYRVSNLVDEIYCDIFLAFQEMFNLVKVFNKIQSIENLC